MGDDESFFDKVYRTTGPRDIAALYDDWAAQYDSDVGGAGYATPARIASALARVLGADAPAAPVLDYGCGTGLAGVALKAAGFAAIDGCDPSEGMIEKARALDIYRETFTFNPLDPPGAQVIGIYPAIVAAGVISVGAAPPEVLAHLYSSLAPGARLAFSYNGHTLEDPAYMAALDRVRADRDCVLEVAEDGPHLPELGLTSRVFVLRRA
ncbi:MAG: methyltransferase domain-containing protein [Paracoccaceae bacterium]|nr:methyltransferase domain-containing protein [Paracoccaceae bacterium]